MERNDLDCIETTEKRPGMRVHRAKRWQIKLQQSAKETWDRRKYKKKVKSRGSSMWWGRSGGELNCCGGAVPDKWSASVRDMVGVRQMPVRKPVARSELVGSTNWSDGAFRRSAASPVHQHQRQSLQAWHWFIFKMPEITEPTSSRAFKSQMYFRFVGFFNKLWNLTQTS